MTIWICLHIWLEMPIHAPKFWIFLCLNPKTWLVTSILGRNRTYRSVHWCDLGARRRNQKRKKVRKETYSDKLDVRPDHTRWGSDICSCMPYGLREVVLSSIFVKIKISWTVFETRGRNSPFPIPKASGLYSSLYTTVQAVTSSSNFGLYRSVEVRARLWYLNDGQLIIQLFHSRLHTWKCIKLYLPRKSS